MLRFLFNRIQYSKTAYNNVVLKRNYFSPVNRNEPTTQDWFNFITTSTNCVIVTSILWGVESYNDKLKMIEDTNIKISELLISYKLLERKCTKSYSDTQNE